MSSTYALYPPSVVDSARQERMQEPRNVESQPHHAHPATPVAANHLSPYSSFPVNSNTASPAQNTNTPAESVSTLSVNYQSSEFSEAGDDPFFGVDFDHVDGGSPAFFENEYAAPGLNHQPANLNSQFQPNKTNAGQQAGSYRPLSPDQTPSLPTSSPQVERKAGQAIFQPFPESISPRELAKPPRQALAVSLDFDQPTQLTPDTSGSGQSSDDGLAPAASVMPAQSPRVTVSYWGKDEADGQYPTEIAQHSGVRSGFSTDDSHVQYPEQGGVITSAPRDDAGRWVPNPVTGYGGLGPETRPSAEGPSMNELAANRTIDERNHEVGDWLAHARAMQDPNASQPRVLTSDDPDGISTREIRLGDTTENNPREGQTYYLDKGGEVVEQDFSIIRNDRNWADAPLLFPIYLPDDENSKSQPQTSQGAIERFERMCRDNESVVSRAATWGTRRRSLPSISDIEGITSGNFLKKLSLSRGDNRRPSILKELRGRLTKMPSATFKRSRSDQEEETPTSGEAPDRKEGLAPPSRSLSWGKKAQTPSINTAFIAMGSNMASIGATHARSGSISTPITSPKSPSGFSLSVKKPLNRIRSKSDISKNPSGIADMWKRTGGPPVASLPKSASAADLEDDDDDDDDLYEDPDMKAESNKMIDGIKPNMDGFREHILKLSPLLANSNNYLVDRIAYHQIQRYKHLLNNKVKHLKYNAGANCPSGALCIAQGGSAKILDAKGDTRQPDPLSARYDGSDGDITPLEGAISQESFPQDIPMPPTGTLPAEFECQLCFSTKKFQKPSDWTKHVHEDVQPFTCTWEKCREPKMFKRKADWVRHENEGHRHLEWWTCDVEDCRHICYRRDNFLQHLVREHKFTEPRFKTKAAIKRAGGVDPTWQKVEKCHAETRGTAKDESCRFCGKEFPTWKKLTVHLAKHMEQISLPILRLVARADLDADTIISPVQDPPPRPFTTTFPIKQEPPGFALSPASAHTPVNRQPGHLAFPNSQPSQFVYQPMVQDFQGMYSFGDMSQPMAAQNMAAGQMNVPQVPPGYPGLAQGYGGMPVTTYITSPNSYIYVAPDTEPFPPISVNALGLQDTSTTHMQYSMMDPTSAVSADHYTPQGSVSPFSHSPHQGQGNFYQQ